ncbi:MAG: ERCC4 domain-containing protein [Nanoarchaeota archaeon]
MTILIDSRETDLIEEFQKQNIPHTIQHLLVGDIIKNNCCIERKEASDFISSVMDGRLLVQCQNMLQNYSRVFIIVHGELSYVYSKFNTHAILGMLASITARANIPILMVNSLSDVAYLSFKILEKATDGKPFGREVVRKSYEADKRLVILSQIDGVSLEKAKSIITKYPTFKDLINATTDDLKQINGIGNVLAQNIYSFFSLFRY